MNYTNIELDIDDLNLNDDVVENSSDSVKCTICLEYIIDDRIDLKCNHSFHKKCLNQWEKETCPLCRVNISYLSYFKKIRIKTRNCIIFFLILFIGITLITIGVVFKMPCIYFDSSFTCGINPICKWDFNDNTLCNYKCSSKFQCYLDCSNCCNYKNCLEFDCKWNNITDANSTLYFCSN